MNNNLKDLNTVIFDMDGVIFDTERLYMESCIEIGGRYGLENVKEYCLKCIGINSVESEKIMRKMYGEDFQIGFFKNEVYELFKERLGDGKEYIKPGVQELLTFLKEKGCKTAIASSTKTEDVKRELEVAGLINFFDEIIGGDMVTKSKPEPDIFLEAVKRLGSSPENCIIIEDSYNGVRAARSGGIPVIMVPDIKKPDDEMRDKATMILDSLIEVRIFLSDHMV